MKAKTKVGALSEFWNSFGYPAFNEHDVPPSLQEDKFEYKYITYQQGDDSLCHEMLLTGSIWDRNASGYSAATANDKKAQEISQFLGTTGIKIDIEGGGALWIRKGNPFSMDMGDPDDNMLRRKLINIIVQFITNY